MLPRGRVISLGEHRLWFYSTLVRICLAYLGLGSWSTAQRLCYTVLSWTRRSRIGTRTTSPKLWDFLPSIARRKERRVSGIVGRDKMMIPFRSFYFYCTYCISFHLFPSAVWSALCRYKNATIWNRTAEECCSDESNHTPSSMSNLHNRSLIQTFFSIEFPVLVALYLVVISRCVAKDLRLAYYL